MKHAPTILLSGGNGYIGGTTAYALREAGFLPVIIDNFSTSKKGLLKNFNVIEADLAHLQSIRSHMEALGPISGIIHFAARALVPESFQKPGEYFRNNLISTFNLAEVASELKVPAFVHSSSCAVYGVPEMTPIAESAELAAHSPYGDTKILAETLLNRYHQENLLKVLHLRYFNPAGAWPKYGWGESHDPETHLIPNVVRAAILNQPVTVFGNRHPTPDGTCIRDFIHVIDLAQAHVLALQALLSNQALPLCLNVGTGRGTSVLEVIQVAQEVLGQKISIQMEPARPGDPPILVAEARQIDQKLRWIPKRTVREMIEDDWRWRTSIVK